ncbi:MAG: hypothetical protein P8P30_01380 [Rickettsiales bacterium]|nr:hypothetical protein [Rickettsiales bacterium]
MTHHTIIVERVIYRILEVAWRCRKLIIRPMLIMPILALIVGLILPKTYEMQTTILFQEPSRINPFMDDISISTGLKERMESLNALLHSRHMLVNVLTDLGIITEDADPQDIAREVERVSSTLKATLDGDDLVTISVRHTDPETMNITLDAVARRFIEKVLTPAWTSLSNSEKFLKEEMKKSQKTLTEAENALAEFKSEHSQELPVLHASNVGRLAKIQTDLAEKRSLLSGAEGAAESLEGRLVQTNPIIGKLEEQIIHYSSELALLRARYTRAHSKVKAVQRTLKRLQEERNRMLEMDVTQLDQAVQVASTNHVWNITVDNDKSQPLLVSQMEQMDLAHTRITSLREEIIVLEQAEKELQEKVHNFGGVERQLLGLERKASVHRELHTNMMRRSEMARVTGDLSKFEVPTRVKIIDRPFQPPKRITPPLFVFAIIGTLGGLMMGCALAAMVNAADTTIRYPYQLAELAGAPVLMNLAPQPAIHLFDLEKTAATPGRFKRCFISLRSQSGNVRDWIKSATRIPTHKLNHYVKGTFSWIRTHRYR